MMTSRLVSTTLTLPADLLEAVDRAVQEGQAESRDELVAAALRHEIAARARAAIDAAIAKMANDEEYQREAIEMAEWGMTDYWQALRRYEEQA